MYREREPVREKLGDTRCPDQSRIGPHISPALRSITSAPDLEATSMPEHPSRTDPREMPVEIGERYHSDSGWAPRLTIRNAVLGLGLIAALGAAWLVRRLLVDHGTFHRLH